MRRLEQLKLSFVKAEMSVVWHRASISERPFRGRFWGVKRICQQRANVANVESRGGISPPRAPRTVREPLDSHGSRCSAVGTRGHGFASSAGSSCCQMASVGPWPRLNNAAPSVQPHYKAFIPTTGPLRPCGPHRYSRPRGCGRLRLLSLHRSDRFSRSVQEPG